MDQNGIHQAKLYKGLTNILNAELNKLSLYGLELTGFH